MRVRIVALIALLALAACSVDNPVGTRNVTEEVATPRLDTKADSTASGTTTGVTAGGGLFGSGH
jgi:hypothetical protein